MSKLTSNQAKEFVKANLNSKFFKNNVPAKMSAYSILDLSVSEDSLGEKIYKALPQDKRDQIDVENKIAESETDVEKLYSMLRKEQNPVSVKIIIEKLMKEASVVPRLLRDLKRSGNDFFIEAAARLLIKSEINYSTELAEIIPQIKYPYTRAVMCYVLGKIGEEEHIKRVYDNFCYFKNNYMSDTYYEGPLAGIYIMKNRYGF